MITENIAFVISVMKGEEKESRPEKNNGKLLKTCLSDLANDIYVLVQETE